MTYKNSLIWEKLAQFQDTGKKTIGQKYFWDLPYCKDKLLRHNINVMHIEKNFFNYIFNIVIDVQGKTKDNEKAIKDLEQFRNQKDLELIPNQMENYENP